MDNNTCLYLKSLNDVCNNIFREKIIVGAKSESVCLTSIFVEVN